MESMRADRISVPPTLSRLPLEADDENAKLAGKFTF